MAYATVQDVGSQFEGIDEDEPTVQQALDEASRIVSNYHLMIYGYTDQESSGELVDFSHDFLSEGVKTDTNLWKIDEYGNKILVNKEPCEATINTVDKYTLMFTPVYSDFSFEIDDRYMIEDTVRRKRAEVYKACALFFVNLASNAEVSSGVERVQVGDLEVEYGNIEAVADAIPNNHFENKFRSIVGTWH